MAAKHHLIGQAEFDRESSKAKKFAFRYDRYRQGERMQLLDGGTYGRKKGAKWIKSDDWGKAAPAADAQVT